MTQPKKFVFLVDVHWGYERRNGHKIPLHDPKAIASVLSFVKDFKPDHVILGGDILDCGAISHHTRNRPGAVEGLRILSDAAELSETLIRPLESLVPGRLVYHIGNHERWLDKLAEELPGLEGMVEVEKLLKLGPQWEVIPQGKASKLGKLHFIHGDQLSGGEHIAKAAVTTYETSVRFGHFHTYQTFTKSTPLESKLGHTGMAVPCLCRKDPAYGHGKPNKWVQGFLWGYVEPSGTFYDFVSIIMDGRFMANGKLYGA